MIFKNRTSFDEFSGFLFVYKWIFEIDTFLMFLFVAMVILELALVNYTGSQMASV